MPKSRRIISISLDGDDVLKFKSVLKYYRDIDGNDSLGTVTRSGLLKMLVSNEHARLIKEKKIV